MWELFRLCDWLFERCWGLWINPCVLVLFVVKVFQNKVVCKFDRMGNGFVL